MKLFWIFIAIAGLAILTISTYQYVTRIGAGDSAPQFELKSIEGNTESLAAYAGRPILLHFFASWCSSCREEFPSLIRFAKKAENPDIAILAIAEDRDEKSVIKFLGNAKSGFPILIDKEGFVADSYYSYGVPETFLIGKDGTIFWRNDGPINWDKESVREHIRKLVR